MVSQVDVRIPRIKWDDAEKYLLFIKGFIPVEFTRAPRTFSDIEHYKTTEFRQILLYTGLVFFKDVLPPEKYIHYWIDLALT